jgi:hypothetical protein
MATNALQQTGSQSRQHTLLIASTDQDQRAFLAAQLAADGHTVYEADSTMAAIAELSVHAIDAPWHSVSNLRSRSRRSRPGQSTRPYREIRPATARHCRDRLTAERRSASCKGTTDSRSHHWTG